MPVNGAEHREQRAVAQFHEAVLFGDRAAHARGCANALVALGESFPADFFGIAFGEDVGAAEKNAFARSEEAEAETADLVKRNVASAFVNESAADVPEEFGFAAVDVLAVDFEVALGIS